MGSLRQLKHLFKKKRSFCQLRSFRQFCEKVEEVESEGVRDGHGHTNPPHIPVMVKEVMEHLKPRDGQVIVDMTFGAGGHTREIIATAPNVRMFVLDRDPEAFQHAQMLSEEGRKGQITPLHGRFSELHALLAEQGVAEGTVDGFLFDLGASSMQFDNSTRGFSLVRDGPLDMRMDGNRFPNQPTAADVVNNLDVADLYEIIKKYGEEKLARRIATAIVETRYAFGKITRTRQLADIISSVFVGNHRKDKLQRHAHVATKTFQALRIFINNEVNELNNGLELAYSFLKPGGVCVALSFHSLEDRIVKRHMHGIDLDTSKNMSISEHYRNSKIVHKPEVIREFLKKRWQPVSKKIVVPSHDSCLENPRARSARLRAAVKIV